MGMLFRNYCQGVIVDQPLNSFVQSVGSAGRFLLGCLTAILSILSSLSLACAQQAPLQKPCAAYSDSFETYRPDLWQEVLIYSKARGAVSVNDGWLSLKTPKDEPCEIGLYSLFTFDGDFDIQADYNLSDPMEVTPCRFNVGLVMQTLGDELSYKNYVAAAQKEGLFFRGRLDTFGEMNLEKYKGDVAPAKGTLRIVRKEGRISFLALEADRWRTLYTFTLPCHEKLRLRFKAQTNGDDEKLLPCPITVKFDNFKINACDRIVEE